LWAAPASNDAMWPSTQNEFPTAALSTSRGTGLNRDDDQGAERRQAPPQARILVLQPSICGLLQRAPPSGHPSLLVVTRARKQRPLAYRVPGEKHCWSNSQGTTPPGVTSSGGGTDARRSSCARIIFVRASTSPMKKRDDGSPRCTAQPTVSNEKSRRRRAASAFQ
jgi:hypothetical protein